VVLCYFIENIVVVFVGDIFSWGMGSGQQLGHGDDEDDVHEPKIIEGKQLEDK